MYLCKYHNIYSSAHKLYKAVWYTTLKLYAPDSLFLPCKKTMESY